MATGISIFIISAIYSFIKKELNKRQESSLKWTPYKGKVREIEVSMSFGRPISQRKNISCILQELRQSGHEYRNISTVNG